MWDHVIAPLAQKAAVHAMTASSQVCQRGPPTPASTHSGWRPSAGPWTQLTNTYRLPLITLVGSVDKIIIKDFSDAVLQLLIKLFHLSRSIVLDRKVQRLQAEVQELEAENQSLQATLEEFRITARRLEQLETEKQSLEQETTVLEREKRQLEKENRRLRQQVGRFFF